LVFALPSSFFCFEFAGLVERDPAEIVVLKLLRYETLDARVIGHVLPTQVRDEVHIIPHIVVQLDVLAETA
jgi:hypothetical protein